jgi:hypothetical protein
MAAAWLSVLKMVPWGDVISNAPKVTEGAKKLWSAVAGQGAAPEAPAPQPTVDVDSQSQAMAEMSARLARAQAAIDGLHAQMLSSTELIQSLAEQNTQLIRRVEANRLRLRWLLACNVVLGAALLLALGMRFLPFA